MNKSLLKPLVNNKQLWDAYLEYVDELIEQQRRALEQTTDTQTMFKAQGAIAQLRTMKYLRDGANSES
jgi:lipase chaperone LimK